MRRRSYILPVVLMLALAACTPTEKKADVPPTPKTDDTQGKLICSPLEPINRAQSTQSVVNLEAVRQAVHSFQVENGRYPSSLEAIRVYLGRDADLGRFDYRPDTGDVTMK